MKQLLTIAFSVICLASFGQARGNYYPKTLTGIDAAVDHSLVVEDSCAVKNGNLVVGAYHVNNDFTKFQVISTTDGVMLPKMTTTQRNAILADNVANTTDSTLAIGLIVFNTTTGAFNYFTGTAWVAIPGAGSGGSITSSGAYAITLTATGTTNVTLPTTGTLVNSAVTSLSSLATLGTLTALDVNADLIRVRTSKTPASAGATGNAGEIAWDASYIYICTATNTWKRVAIATW